MEISIRIDWISVTDHKMKSGHGSSHPCLHDGLWTETNGKLGYTVGQKHPVGATEYRNYNREDMGCHVIYSGKALEKMKAQKNISGTDVLIHHINEGHNVARLDLAIDFIGYGAKVDFFTHAFKNGQVKTKLRKANIIKSLTGDGETLYIGSMKKRKNLVRVYNKGAENGTGADWIRVELQIMGKKATSTGKEICDSEDIKQTIIGIIKGVVDFPTVSVWNNLTAQIETIKMSSVPKTQGDTEKWLMKQVVPALARTIVLNLNFWIQFKFAVESELPERTFEEFVDNGWLP